MTARTSSLEGRNGRDRRYGAIGREIAQRARAFGAKIAAVSRSRPQDDLIESAHTLAELPDVLGTADAIVIAIALTPETRKMFDAAAFARCKKGALLVNIARGGVIDQPALIEALTSGQLGGAGPRRDRSRAAARRRSALARAEHPDHAALCGAGSPKSVGRIVASVTDNPRRFRTTLK